MEHKPSSLLLVGVLGIAMLCAGPVHALRLLNDANNGFTFSFGSKAAATGAETEPLDLSLSDDYHNEISNVEFEPELGSAAPYVVTVAPIPAVTTVTVATAAAAGPATTEHVRARNATATGTAGSSHNMKWWLPSSTMPLFLLFPNDVV